MSSSLISTLLSKMRMKKNKHKKVQISSEYLRTPPNLSMEDLEIQEERWVRKLNALELNYENQQSKFGQGIACYVLGLCCREGLKYNSLQEALTLLYQKVPTLRLIIREKGKEMWFAYRQNENIDFQVVESENVEKSIEEEIHTPLNSIAGPMWRARLIKMQRSEPHLVSDDKMISKKYPRQYYLLFTFHQSTTDGYSALFICNLFIKILNAVIEGRGVDAEVQLGEFDDGRQTDILTKRRKAKLESDINRLESVKADIKELSRERPMVTEAFRIPEERKRNTTLHTQVNLTKKDTEKLYNFFKEENLTINNGFLALVNLSLIAMLQKRGFKRDSYDVASFNSINMRRFWSGDTSRMLGCHVGSVCLLTETPSNSHHNFLEYAHDIQTNMSDYLENKRVFDEKLYLNILDGSSYKSFDDFFEKPPENVQFFHSTSNMGNLSKHLESIGQHVQVSHFDRSVSIHRSNSAFSNALLTYRGRLHIGVDYNANNITSDVADEYVRTIKALLADIIKQM